MIDAQGPLDPTKLDFIQRKIAEIDAKLAKAPARPLVMPKRFLTHDEIESFPGIRKDSIKAIKVRIRVWQGKDATPIALVSQAPRQEHPRAIATQVANYINEAILHYPEAGYLYFEDAIVQGKPYLVQQRFEYFGHDLRLRLYRPSTQPKDWDFLEFAVGSKIER